MDVTCDLGTWLDSAVRNTPRGHVAWKGIPGRVWTAAIGEREILATVRKSLNSAEWVVSIPGFLWDVRGERGSTTTRALNILQSPARAFPTSREAKKAVTSAYADLMRAVGYGAPAAPT